MSAPQMNGNGNGHPAAPIPAAETSATQSKVQPNDVGWQFVPQYYNFVNKSPHRLHCFYNKRSTFLHGEEGEDAQVALGQQVSPFLVLANIQEIHDRITSIGYEDCKVYIHQIDSQSSANGGIVILVIGEMSNLNGPWRKFTQTFFLAEQPNGYFVLNDIFRYLKEDIEEEEDEEEAAPAAAAAVSAQAEEVPEAVEVKATEEIVAPVDEAAEEEVTPTPAPVEEEPIKEQEAVEEVPEPTNEPAHPDPAAVPEEAVVASVPDKDVAPSEPAAAVEEPTTSAAPAEETAPVASPAPTPAQPATNGSAKPAAAAPAAPTGPPKPKSWASMAAAAARPAASTAPAVSAPPAAVPKAQQAPAQPQQAQEAAPAPSPAASSSRSQAYDNATKIKTPHCFVKLPNWAQNDSTDQMDESALRVASTRFGEVVKVEIVGSKACAFVEFKQVESARKAIIASLQTNLGGEGGVKVAGQNGALIYETRKEKDERRVKGAPGQGPERGPGQMNGGGRGGGGGARGGRGGAPGGQRDGQPGQDGFIERGSGGRGGRGGRGRGGAPQGDRQQPPK